uniref:MACPF domain-containing protein n=1 Tax=Neogobius melanostomus TaxID=47308 RepID=A0A8C6WNB3_9GOBI
MEHPPLALLVLLSLLSLGRCYITGTGAVCKLTPFFPGHNLAGEGYDIVTLKRKGAYLIDMKTFMTPNGTCHLITNPLQGNQLQKLPLSAVDLRAFSRCESNFYQTEQSSVSTVVQEMTHQDSSDWKVGLDVDKFGGLEVGGSRSDQYSFASTRVKQDKFTFSIHRSSCTHYMYRVSDTPPLSSEFKNDVSRLPPPTTPPPRPSTDASSTPTARTTSDSLLLVDSFDVSRLCEAVYPPSMASPLLGHTPVSLWGSMSAQGRYKPLQATRAAPTFSRTMTWPPPTTVACTCTTQRWWAAMAGWVNSPSYSTTLSGTTCGCGPSKTART